MVEDRTTDGERIAQLLASELSGRSDGPLGRFSVVDADRDATPSPEGTTAYHVAVDDTRVADVRIYPAGADLRIETDKADGALAGGGIFDIDGFVEGVAGPGLTVESTAQAVTLDVEYGAAVKRVVDALVAGVDT